ncbi:17849_t:CDS:2 [Acaulospora morrowiae]|uniref:17849_t:CDS:1 n=1 Tax=Acaulospora morrowiae TaxID=94023 RepID=A0A9N8VDV1_9GLOM|nr:17849_t:CDS:2 [Acaulospora morrowiae]
MSSELEKSKKTKSEKKKLKLNESKGVSTDRGPRKSGGDNSEKSKISKTKGVEENENSESKGKHKKSKQKKSKGEDIKSSERKRKSREVLGSSNTGDAEKSDVESVIKVVKKVKTTKDNEDVKTRPEVIQTKTKTSNSLEANENASNSAELPFDTSEKYITSTVSSRPVAVNENRPTPFRKVNAEMLIDLPPKAFEDFDKGVFTYINALIMQYVEELDGIVLAYENVQLCDKTGYIYEDSPYCHFFVRADFILWDASKGCRMVGKVIRQSPLHIALLLYESFNVKINRQSIPDDVFEWRDDDLFYDVMFSDKQLELDRLYQDGQWYDKRTGEGLTDCWIEFEAVGSEIDEGIIFVVGSLQYYSKNPVQENRDAFDQVQFDMSALDLTIGTEKVLDNYENNLSMSNDENNAKSSLSSDSSDSDDSSVSEDIRLPSIQ